MGLKTPTSQCFKTSVRRGMSLCNPKYLELPFSLLVEFTTVKSSLKAASNHSCSSNILKFHSEFNNLKKGSFGIILHSKYSVNTGCYLSVGKSLTNFIY